MVRTYKRSLTHIRKGKYYTPYRSYSEENLRKALEAVSRGMTILEAASRYGVPKSTICSRKLGKHILQCSGRPPRFSEKEELSFVEHLNALSQWGFPFDTLDLRLMVRAYLDKQGIQDTRFKKNLPGYDWAKKFLERNKSKISYKFSANISAKRANLSCQVLDQFFENAEDVLRGIDPDNLVNFDETNLTDNPGNKKFIFKRGTKYPERVVNSTKTAISLMFAGTASGIMLPIYVVYKGDHLWDKWTEGGPPRTTYNRSKSGWFDAICFEDWFMTVIVPYFQNRSGRKVVVGDNLSSHFSENVIKKCKEMDIHFICLPANATHVMQPLDVAFYGPLKKYWRRILGHWKKKQGRKFASLPKDKFPHLLVKVTDELKQRDAGARNLISGFEKTGLYPFNPDRPKSRLPQPTEGDTSLVSDSVLSMLQELRHDPEQPKQRKKKIRNIEPGKSVAPEDFLVASTSTVVPDVRPPLDDDFFSSEEELPLITFKKPKVPAAINIPKEGDWALVQYNTKKNGKQFFVGQITAIEHVYIKINFLKRSTKTDRFLFPPNKDEDLVSQDMILQILEEPLREGSEKRAFYTFQENLEFV